MTRKFQVLVATIGLLSLGAVITSLPCDAAVWIDDPSAFSETNVSYPPTATLPNTPTSLSLTLTAGGLRALGAGSARGAMIREELAEERLGSPRIASAGKPDLAQRVVEVLVPYDADLRSLELTFGPTTRTGVGRFAIRPVGISAADDPLTEEPVEEDPGYRLDPMGRDPEVYGSSNLWPARTVVVQAVSQLRQYRSVHLLFSPYQWNPATGKLFAVTQPITLTWGRRPVPAAAIREALSDPVVREEVGSIFIDYDTASSWYSLGGYHRPTRFNYVILIPREFHGDSSVLEEFAAHKEAQGFSVAIVSVDCVDASYSGAERSDRIRSFLRDKYSEWGIDYVLLIGDPDPYDQYVGATDRVGNVPMKMAWPRGDGSKSKSDGEACPTDHYYGDLSADWDVDGDGYAAAYDDDFTTVSVLYHGGGSDYTLTSRINGWDNEMEVRVGRIPYQVVSEADAALDRAIDYENADPSSSTTLATNRTRVFLAMSRFKVNTDYAYLGRQIQTEFLAPEGLDTRTLYDTDAVYPSTYPLENEKLITQWSRVAAGIVLWAGHGYPDHAKIFQDDSDLMKDTRVAELNDATAAFVFEGSCQNAWPEDGGNLAHTLIADRVVATIAGTRNSWYAEEQEDFGTGCKIGDLEYFVAKKYADHSPSGKALWSMRHRCSPGGSTDLQNMLTYNLYGEPSIRYTTE